MQNVIKELGLEDLSKKEQQDIVNQMTEAVIKRITYNVLQNLSEEGKKEFHLLVQKESPKELEDFLKSKVENYEAMVKETAEEFIIEMKEKMNK